MWHSEEQIVDAIDRQLATRLIVAHRPAFITRAHRKILVTGGQVQDMTDQFESAGE